MKTALLLYKEASFLKEKNDDGLNYEAAQLLIGFGAPGLISDPDTYAFLRKRFPLADIALCSSAGEIYQKEVVDDTITLTAHEFSATAIKTSQIDIADYDSGFTAGKALVENLPDEGLRLIFVLSDGGKVNGSELVKGMNAAKSKQVLITGGLAGDADRFEKTYVGLNSVPQTGKIIAIGFYGDKLLLSHGSLGGWETFGLKKTVTKSSENILYEIDNKNALDLYKNYLGIYASELPGSALLFPLALTLKDSGETIVRTILSIDNNNKSMTFAGDLPVGSEVQFMKANFDKLVDAASDAANTCLAIQHAAPKLAILISCVGRKLILGNRIEEEVEAVSDIFGTATLLTGFYSYGEISPMRPFSNCELHNQTMTITGLNEIE